MKKNLLLLAALALFSSGYAAENQIQLGYRALPQKRFERQITLSKPGQLSRLKPLPPLTRDRLPQDSLSVARRRHARILHRQKSDSVPAAAQRWQKRAKPLDNAVSPAVSDGVLQAAPPVAPTDAQRAAAQRRHLDIVVKKRAEAALRNRRTAAPPAPPVAPGKPFGEQDSVPRTVLAPEGKPTHEQLKARGRRALILKAMAAPALPPLPDSDSEDGVSQTAPLDLKKNAVRPAVATTSPETSLTTTPIPASAFSPRGEKYAHIFTFLTNNGPIHKAIKDMKHSQRRWKAENFRQKLLRELPRQFILDDINDATANLARFVGNSDVVYRFLNPERYGFIPQPPPFRPNEPKQLRGPDGNPIRDLRPIRIESLPGQEEKSLRAYWRKR